MTIKTEGQHRGEFLVTEGNGEISREAAPVTSGQVLVDGRVVKLVSGKLVKAAGSSHTDGTSDEAIVGIVFGPADASGGEIKSQAYIARDAEVKLAKITLHEVTGGGAATATAAVKAKLATLGFILR